MVEGGSILHADHPRKWVIFARRFTQRPTVGVSVRAHSVVEKQSLHRQRLEIETLVNRSLAEQIRDGALLPTKLEILEKVLEIAKQAIEDDDKRLFINCGREFHCLSA